MGRTARVGPGPARCSDHPHAGGENPASQVKLPRSRGPSPRGWGEQRRAAMADLLRRTIPTRVGRTIRAGLSPIVLADHPHAGGENSFTMAFHSRLHGPSPRGWGELRIRAPLYVQNRTIPTRVGRTCACSQPFLSWPDHPHAGGENAMNPILSFLLLGPSPRGWGEHGQLYERPNTDRTIPTRVGRTTSAPGT